MTGTKEGAQKAVETKREEGTLSSAAKKAAETRKERDPEAFEEIGREGGKHSHGGGKSSR
jgi:general stress protein YciG